MVKSCPITNWSIIRMPFEYRTKFFPVFKTPFEYRTSIRMVVWILNYHLNTGHLNTGQVKVCYSDVSVIQIPTVVGYSNSGPWSCFWIAPHSGPVFETLHCCELTWLLTSCKEWVPKADQHSSPCAEEIQSVIRPSFVNITLCLYSALVSLALVKYTSRWEWIDNRVLYVLSSTPICCVFWPANGCSARRSLVEINFLTLKA